MLREFQTACTYIERHGWLKLRYWVGSLALLVEGGIVHDCNQLIFASKEIQILFTIKNLITFSDNLYRKHHLH